MNSILGTSSHTAEAQPDISKTVCLSCQFLSVWKALRCYSTLNGLLDEREEDG